jgi:quinol monooxygenase YgiN
MIRASIRMLVPLAKHKEVLHILDMVAEKARGEKGCLACHLYRGVEDRRLIHYEQNWETEADMKEHLRSENYRKVLLVMEIALEQPEIRFDRIEDSSGMNTIEAARKTNL